VEKKRVIHRNYLALTTTTILVYTLLTVNLFTARVQNHDVDRCHDSSFKTALKKKQQRRSSVEAVTLLSQKTPDFSAKQATCG
jgi:hypothetical protein